MHSTIKILNQHWDYLQSTVWPGAYEVVSGVMVKGGSEPWGSPSWFGVMSAQALPGAPSDLALTMANKLNSTIDIILTFANSIVIN